MEPAMNRTSILNTIPPRRETYPTTLGPRFGGVRRWGVTMISGQATAGLAPDQVLILKGPWPWTHDLFMETKEHLFFVPLVLALYLPFAGRGRLFANKAARNRVLAVAALIVWSGLTVEGAGAAISHGVKVATVQTGGEGVE